LNRSRLKGNDGEESALTSLAVLFEVLLTMTMIMSPFTPFFAEYLYQRLRSRLPTFVSSSVPSDLIGKADSIHYVMLPTAVGNHGDDKFVAGMRLLQQTVELGRRAREAVNISMKIPVKEVLIVCASESIAALNGDLKDYLLEELNAWGVSLTADVEKWCSISAIPNLPVLAKRLGNRIRAATRAIKSLDSLSLRAYTDTNRIAITVEGESIELVADDLLVKSTFSGNGNDYAAMTSADGTLTVAISTIQDEILRKQAIVRDLCNRINKLRKKAKLNITDKIDVFYTDIASGYQGTDQTTSACVSTADALSQNQTLLDKANIVPIPWKACHGQKIISDIHATLFGPSYLKIALALPVPSLAPATKQRCREHSVLEILIASCNMTKKRLHGSLASSCFDLVADVDVFSSTTAARRR